MKNEPYIRKSYSRILLHDNLWTNNNDINIISESTNSTLQEIDVLFYNFMLCDRISLYFVRLQIFKINKDL